MSQTRPRPVHFPKPTAVRRRATPPSASSSTVPLPPSPRAAFRSSILSARPSFGWFLDGCSPLIAEQLAHLGCLSQAIDWLLVDAQHSPLGPSQLAAMLTAISAGGMPSLVRVGGPGDRVGIQQALDMGAWGVMVPTVQGAEDAERAVAACRFPPRGSRSIAWPIRWGCCSCFLFSFIKSKK
jgi:4-hydroxy-2-oxoheptanedioate aldolase